MASKPIAAPGLRCKAKAAPRPAPAGDATDAEPDPESESAEAVPVKAPPPLSPYEAAGLIADIIVCAKRLGRWTERLVHLPLMEESRPILATYANFHAVRGGAEVRETERV